MPLNKETKWNKWPVRSPETWIKKKQNGKLMHKALHPRYDVDRLYVKIIIVGKRLINNRGCVDVAIQGLEEYIKKRVKRDKSQQLKNYNKTNRRIIPHQKKKRATKTSRKKLHTRWLIRGNLKKEAESILFLAKCDIVEMIIFRNLTIDLHCWTDEGTNKIHVTCCSYGDGCDRKKNI